MVLFLLATTGLVLLVVVGVHQFLTRPLSGPEAKRHNMLSEESTTFTRSDIENPGRMLEDTRKLLNGLVVVVQISVIVMAVWMSIYVYTIPALPIWFKLLVVATLVVGALLVGRGLYLRLGLYEPVTLQESLRTTVGERTAEDFAAIRGAADTCRTDGGDALDDLSVGLLAAAKNEQSVERLRGWADAEGVAEPAVVDDRVETLEEAEVIRREGDRLAVSGQLVDADPDADQLASVAASVLD